MASGFSTYAAEAFLKKALNISDFTPPTSLWVALFTTGLAGSTYLRLNTTVGAGEVSTSGTGYARKEIIKSGGTADNHWVAPTQLGNGDWTVDNADAIIWNEATAAWGSINAVALMDASSGGNVWWWIDLSTPKAVSPPDILRISTGMLDIQMYTGTA